MVQKEYYRMISTEWVMKCQNNNKVIRNRIITTKILKSGEQDNPENIIRPTPSPTHKNQSQGTTNSFSFITVRGNLGLHII